MGCALGQLSRVGLEEVRRGRGGGYVVPRREGFSLWKRRWVWSDAMDEAAPAEVEAEAEELPWERDATYMLQRHDG